MSDDGTRSRPAPRTAAVQVYAHTGTGEPPRLPNSPPTRPKGAAGGACAISRTLSRTRSRDASPRSKAQPVPTEGERYGAARDALRTAVLETMELLEAAATSSGPARRRTDCAAPSMRSLPDTPTPTTSYSERSGPADEQNTSIYHAGKTTC